MNLRVVKARAGEPVRSYYRRKGEAVEVSACCDCGLVHVMQYVPRKRYIIVRAWRDEERTVYIRKRRKDKKKRKK